jgi:hypothetical protein
MTFGSSDRAFNPTVRKRIAVSLLVGAAASAACLGKERATPTHPADFGLSWFGAQSLLRGENPYARVGPGLEYDWPWPLVYPATAFVAVAPLALLPRLEATRVFVFVSFGLLTFGITRDGWFRLPMFGSIAVITAAAVGQWSPLLTASLELPWAGFFLGAKPTDGLAIAIGAKSRTRIWALAGAAVLGLGSLALFPGWPLVWMRQLHYADVQMAPPLFRGGGFLILLALLRWRRPESRLLLALAVIPQVGSWYTAVPLFMIPRNSRETMALAALTSLAWLLQDRLITATSEAELNAQVGSLIVAFAFLPCVWMVLQRPLTPRT